MPARDKFRTRAGDLTPYALACGYVQKYGEHVQLFQNHGVYHVSRSPVHAAGYAWESVYNLGTARKIARRLASETPAN